MMDWLDWRFDALSDMALAAVCFAFASAGLVTVLPWRRAAWLIACAAAIAVAVLAASAAMVVAPAEGSALVGASRFVFPLVAVLLAAVVAASSDLRDAQPRAASLGYALLLSIGGGWMLALIAQDWILLFIGVEIAALSGIGLAALCANQGRTALRGAASLFVSSAAASIFLALGAALLTRASGAPLLEGVALGSIAAPALGALGAGLVLVALAMRAGVAPLQPWAAQFFGRASDVPVLAVGAMGCIGALGVLIHVASFLIQAPALGEYVAAALLTLGLASVALGSLQAIGADDLRRLGGYALAAQAGCVLVAASLGSPAGYAAALLVLFALAATALIYGAAMTTLKSAKLNALDGFGRRRPFSGAALAAAALSFMGAPLTTTFLGRWQIMEASVGADWWWAASAGVFASLAGVVFGGRLVERMYFRKQQEVVAAADGWSLSIVPALVLGLIGIAWGAAPGVLIESARQAANEMTVAAP
jgi:NADH:ubiquinone oxidoreductase subunit 2 (subunit N)